MSDRAKTYIEHFLSDEQGREAYVAGSLIADVHWLLNAAFDDTKMNYAELGERLGVSRARAHQVITGDGNLTLEVMSRAAAAFGCMWHVSLDNLKTGRTAYALEPAHCRVAIEWHSVESQVYCPTASAAANGNYEKAA